MAVPDLLFQIHTKLNLAGFVNVNPAQAGAESVTLLKCQGKKTIKKEL